MLQIKIKKIKDGTLPSYKREGDVCMDCRSRVYLTLAQGERALVPLGFALELPVGFEAVIRPRSGNSKNGIDVAIGTIDTNYRGEVMACVINNSGNFFVIDKGDRICQLAIREAPVVEWEVVSELSKTNRNDKGFGSTGLK
jgi:dUTP pyrophosphatase